MIKAVIGMSLSKFDILAVDFAAAPDAVQLERCHRGETKQVPSGGPKGHLDTFGKKLFFILYYLGPTPPSTCWASISASVQGMPTTMWRTMWRTSCPPCCGACRSSACCLRGRLGPPRSSSDSSGKYGDVVVDGLECSCVRPQDEELQKARLQRKEKTPHAQGRRRHDLGFQGAEKDYGAKSKINLPHKRPKKSKNNRTRVIFRFLRLLCGRFILDFAP